MSVCEFLHNIQLHTISAEFRYRWQTPIGKIEINRAVKGPAATSLILLNEITCEKFQKLKENGSKQDRLPVVQHIFVSFLIFIYITIILINSNM